MAILDHMGKESSFLPQSASFPSFPPQIQCYPSHQIPSHLFVGKDSSPLQNAKPHKSFSTNSFLYLCFILFLFIYIIALNFLFFLFFPKTWNSSPKLKIIPQHLGRIIEEKTPLGDTRIHLYHVKRCGHHKKLSIAKLDFVQVCGLLLNFYN